MEKLPAELQELVDRQKIYHVLTSYCRALDRCDVELMKSVYWEDGFDDHGVFAGNAQEFAELSRLQDQRHLDAPLGNLLMRALRASQGQRSMRA